MPTPAPATTTPFAPQAVDVPSAPIIYSDFPGIFILSLTENGYAHLFAYSPVDQPLLRLSSGAWDDTSPALSPDGTQIAFASNRSGYWDLYTLDLASGQTTQITDSHTYDGAPSWSPDGAWLASESYLNGNLEIVVQPIDADGQQPIRLTNHSAADYSPTWAAEGRKIAFVSTRSGDSEIWLANLDHAGDDNYINLSHTPHAVESHPVWTQDGDKLAWASNSYNAQPSGIYVWDSATPDRPALWVGNGDRPAWNAYGNSLVAFIEGANQSYLTAYRLDGSLIMQSIPLNGSPRGLLWLPNSLPETLPQSYRQAAAQTPAPLWEIATNAPADDNPLNRHDLAPLEDVQAPYPQLHDHVDEAFNALRERITETAGWEVLANLENAFVPLTTSLDPGMANDWLYTGRAFSLNPVIANAGWMVVERQEINSQTYWKIYLRAQAQDGSMGEPLHTPLWDLSARYDLNPENYELGGSFASVPSGYWINFTALAADYGWQRQPALPNWHSYYSGARFTKFVMSEGLDWYDAMLELYPREILLTPTYVAPATYTPTRTPLPTSTRWPTRTPYTPQPTSTPLSLFEFATPTP